MRRDENTYKEHNNVFVSQFRCTLWEQTNSTEPYGTILTDTFGQLVDWLKSNHKRSIHDKSTNLLLTPAFFSPSRVSVRAADNVCFANIVVLDIDDGDLTPKHFSTLLPHVRMVCFNTFSSTKAQLRWRVFMPTTEPVSFDEYRCIAQQVVQVVKDDGFTANKRRFAREGERVHGIDLSKLSAENLFYLPCQPQDASGRVFQDCKDDHRHPIKPSDWMTYSILSAQPQRQWFRSRRMCEGIDHVAVKDAIAHWRKVGPTPGAGNYEFFMLGLRLGMAGISDSEIRVALDSEAAYANNPPERRQKMASVFASLRRYGVLR
jgi:hypothetical protein